MSLGKGNIDVNQRREPIPPPGPPFLLTSADNGLSVDTVSGRIVLGQDVGAPGDPAQFLSAREIPMAGFSFTMNSNLFRHLFIDPAAGDYRFGDIDGSANGLNIIIADFVPVFLISSTLGNFFNIDPTNTQFNLDTLSGVLLQGDGASGLLNFVAPNGITTSDPGTGSGSWRLGQVKAAASVFDATRFVEINISGAVVKLAVVV